MCITLQANRSGMLGDMGPSLEFKVSCTVNFIYILFEFQKLDMRCMHLTWHHFQDRLMRTQSVSLVCSKSTYALDSTSCSVTEHGIFLGTGDILEWSVYMESDMNLAKILLL